MARHGTPGLPNPGDHEGSGRIEGVEQTSQMQETNDSPSMIESFQFIDGNDASTSTDPTDPAFHTSNDTPSIIQAYLKNDSTSSPEELSLQPEPKGTCFLILVLVVMLGVRIVPRACVYSYILVSTEGCT